MSAWNKEKIDSLLKDYQEVVSRFEELNKRAAEDNKRIEEKRRASSEKNVLKQTQSRQKGDYMKSPKGIMTDIYNVYKSAAEQRIQAEDLFEVARQSHNGFRSNDILEVAEDKAKFLRAERNYKETISKIQKETAEMIDALTNAYTKSVDNFYTANAEKVDSKQLELLKSGILTEKELYKMANDNETNPTMYRLVAKYCEGKDSLEMRSIVNNATTKDGRKEYNALEQLKEWGSRTVTDDKKKSLAITHPDYLEIGAKLIDDNLGSTNYGDLGEE